MTDENGRVVASVGIGKGAGALIEDAVEQGYEQTLRIVLLQKIVNSPENNARLAHMVHGGRPH